MRAAVGTDQGHPGRNGRVTARPRTRADRPGVGCCRQAGGKGGNAGGNAVGRQWCPPAANQDAGRAKAHLQPGGGLAGRMCARAERPGGEGMLQGKLILEDWGPWGGHSARLFSRGFIGALVHFQARRQRRTWMSRTRTRARGHLSRRWRRLGVGAGRAKFSIIPPGSGARPCAGSFPRRRGQCPAMKAVCGCAGADSGQ